MTSQNSYLPKWTSTRESWECLPLIPTHFHFMWECIGNFFFLLSISPHESSMNLDENVAFSFIIGKHILLSILKVDCTNKLGSSHVCLHLIFCSIEIVHVVTFCFIILLFSYFVIHERQEHLESNYKFSHHLSFINFLPSSIFCKRCHVSFYILSTFEFQVFC